MTTKTIRQGLSVALVLALGACGGGGGSKSSPPPATSPPPTPDPPTTPQPAFDAHLALTNTRAAQARGLTGKGLRIGVVDSGVMRNHPTLAGRVVANYTYLDSPPNNLTVDDVVGHGTTVAQLAAGAAAGSWPGGVAPGAEIVSARIIADERPRDDGSGQGNEVTGALGMASVHQDLINAGVRIMNNSWGGLYWTRASATAAIAAEYRPFVVDHDGLVVFATGNESRGDPSDTAALPSKAGVDGSLPAADLERGWLAVAALDTAKPTQLASYSNACGVAKSYCLVAPGTAAFVGHESTAGNLQYFYGSGTSYAAPLVSGAAALVWEAFPYFNNDLVRQTLLGTATDLGAPGPDAVFGYGLLNVGKAVLGPGRFDWGDVTVNVDQTGLNSTWRNPISGAGGLVKTGVGALVLTGTNSYAGTTRIERGTLALRDGGSIRSAVTITAQSTPSAAALQFMSGDNRVTGSVDNGGSVILLAGDGTGTIEGNYVQRSNALLMVALGTQALQVTGTATLAGGVQINGMVGGYVAQDGKRQDLVQAGGGVSGEFTLAPAVTGNAGLSLLESHYGYDANHAWLVLDRVSVTRAAAAAGAGSAARSSAQRVEQAFELLDADATAQASPFATAAAALQRVDGGFAGLERSLESLSGRAHAAATTMTFDSIDMQRRALSSQFAGKGAAPAADGTWMRALGGGGQGGYLGSDYNVGGWMMGRDVAIAGNGVLGFAFGQTRANDAGGTSLERSRDRQTQSQVYAGRGFGQAYLLGQAGFGRFQRELDRGLLLGSERAGVQSRYGGRFLSGSIESGYRFGTAARQWMPYLGVEYARIDNDAFHEQGGQGFGLRSEAWSSRRLQALAGMRGSYRWKRVALNGYAEWQQALQQSGLALDARFVGIDAWAPLDGVQPWRSGGLFGVSLEAWMSAQARLSLGYDQRFGPRAENRQVSLRLAREF